MEFVKPSNKAGYKARLHHLEIAKYLEIAK